MILSKSTTAIIVSVLLSFSIYADEAKGYKVVLASFSTFVEAKEKLNQLGQHLDEDDRALQDKYQYEIVARVSGKAYIVGIEPLETKEIANEVIKQFHDSYPEAYSNGYFGPTEGAVILEHAKVSAVAEANTSGAGVLEDNQTNTKLEMNKTPLPLEMKKEKSSFFWPLIGLILFTVVMGMGLTLFRRRKKSHQPSIITPQDIVSQTDFAYEASVISEGKKEISAIKEQIVVPMEEQENDIFYRLKNNMFFMTLIQELKEASAKKDASRCRDLMDEVMRYQKNFRQSTIISAMDKAVEEKSFDSLSALLNREMK